MGSDIKVRGEVCPWIADFSDVEECYGYSWMGQVLIGKRGRFDHLSVL